MKVLEALLKPRFEFRGMQINGANMIGFVMGFVLVGKWIA